MNELNKQSELLLSLLVSRIPTITAGKPETYPTYTECHSALGLPDEGNVGRTLEKNGMGDLAFWLRDNGYPAITGMIVSTKDKVAGMGYFTVYDKVIDQSLNLVDYDWWHEQIRLSVDYDWSLLINSTLESLRPTKKANIIDLVQESGIDVSDWGKGKNVSPSQDGAYCYNWSFQSDSVSVVCLWFRNLEIIDDSIGQRFNLKALNLTGIRKHRADNMDRVLNLAFDYQLPLRVVLLDGTADPQKVTARRLDDESWHVSHYNHHSGDCIALRGIAPFIDQHSADTNHQAENVRRTSTIYNRSGQVRDKVLKSARGHCEWCGEPGFRTHSGSIYLETHHIDPLSEGGPDTIDNVIAVCPNDHMKAHHGENRVELRMQMKAKIRARYNLS